MLYYGLEQHSLDSYFQFKELGSAPSTPTANEIRLYAKDDGSGVSTLCYKNDAGTEICLPSSGSIVTGTGVSGRLAFWNGTSTLSSDADLTFATDTLTATKIIAPTSITISTLTAGSLVFAGTAGLLSQDNSHLFWDDTNDTLYIGTTTSPNSGVANRGFVLTKAGAITECDLYGFGNVGQGVVFRGSVARGTLASPTQALSGDNIAITAVGHDNSTGWATLARIDLQAAENITTTSQGSLIVFNTKATGSTTLAERFRVGPSGQWGIGGATFGTALDVFTSGGASAAPTWTSPGALTKADDTNVTLTLGGTPSTALLRAVSLTLGWTGTLGVTRGGTGTGTALTQGSVVFAGASGVYSQDNTNFFWDNTNKRLGIGTASPASKLNTASLSTSAARGIISDQYSADTNGATIIGRKTRGTSVGSFTAVASGDVVCSFRSHASDGSGFLTGYAFLRTLATETQSSTNQGTKVQIQTVATGGTTASVALELGADKGVVLPQTTSYLDLSAISAGNVNVKATFTSATPATTWTAGVPSNNPSGYIQWSVGGTTYYQPLWT